MSPIKTPTSIQLLEKQETRTSRGMLSKGWYRVDDQLVMVKGNSITELEQLDMSLFRGHGITDCRGTRLASCKIYADAC